MFKRILLKFIEIYQMIMSPFLGKHCRFLPTCSEYAKIAIEKHGALKGVVFSFWRVARCNPWSKGGVDMP